MFYFQAQYGMDGSSGYQQQSEAALEKEVARGNISITDYHQQKGRIRQIAATGMDDGISRTQGRIYQSKQPAAIFFIFVVFMIACLIWVCLASNGLL